MHHLSETTQTWPIFSGNHQISQDFQKESPAASKLTMWRFSKEHGRLWEWPGEVNHCSLAEYHSSWHSSSLALTCASTDVHLNHSMGMGCFKISLRLGQRREMSLGESANFTWFIRKNNVFRNILPTVSNSLLPPPFWLITKHGINWLPEQQIFCHLLISTSVSFGQQAGVLVGLKCCLGWRLLQV